MAKGTSTEHRSLVIYEVFVRNHGPNGTFRELEMDLPRIRSMGVDVIWLMPVHPVGKLGRKGSAGSPYSVRNYCEVDPAYGTINDLSRLVETAHGLGLKVIMDVVFNHAARDCHLVHEHPEWFADAASPRNALPDWTDVIAFDHENSEVTRYLIGVLDYWASFGMDGFRCDVACFLPLSFWLEARERLESRYPDLIWLAESAHIAYVAERRDAGLPVLSDNELYQAFDLTSDYDALPIWSAVLEGRAPLARYAELLRIQDGIYPGNFVKLRFVENHDQARIMAVAPTREQALAWTAFQAFNKGAFLIHAGQEAGACHTPSLFERDPIDWGDYTLQAFLTRVAHLKKEPAAKSGRFVITNAGQVLQAAWESENGGLYGIFDFNGNGACCQLPLPEAPYPDILSGTTIRVWRGACRLPDGAVILRYPEPLSLRPFHSDLLDYHIRLEESAEANTQLLS